MMAHFLCHMLLLVFLSDGGVVLVKASNNAISCGYDVNCQAIVKLTGDVDEIKSKLDKLDSSPEVNEKLDKLATNVNDIHIIQGKQVKDLEELKVNMNKSLSSTAAVSTQLERHSANLLSHDEHLKKLDLLLTNMNQLVQNIYWAEMGPQDCTDIRTMGSSISGVYRVYTRRIATDVYCDFRSSTESWLVFQRRRDGSQNFDRTWAEYAHGFGVIGGEFWIGNEKLSLLTMNKKYKLRIELEDFQGEKRWAEYSTFSVKPSTDKYRLTVGGYSGNAADSLAESNNMMFSTKDADNDIHTQSGHCAQWYQSGWWFRSCMYANLNGLYLGGSHSRVAAGIYWYHWKGPLYSLKAAEMKISALK